MATTRTIAMMCESDALGGAEMVILRLAMGLADRGYRIVGIGPDEETQPDRGSNGWLREKFADAGYPWRTYRKRRPVDRALAPQLATILDEAGVDAVHSHEFGMAVYGASAARRARMRHVISMHGNDRMTSKWTRRAALRWAFKRSHATIAVSDQTRDHLEETLGIPAGRIVVIRNGVPEREGDRAAGRRAVGAESDELVVLAVGSLIPRKGHDLLIRAVAGVQAACPELRIRLAIAGTGVERGNLERLAAELGAGERVHLLGPRDDVPDLLAASDVFAMPSHWEGLPLALLEAMFAARPIVASNVAGIPEAIRPEREGILTPPGDVDAVAAALRRFLTDPDLRTELGGAARDRAREEFSIDAMTDAYERLYFES